MFCDTLSTPSSTLRLTETNQHSISYVSFPNTMISSSYIVANIVALGLTALVIHGFLSFQTVGEALGFYGVYHRNPINQLIHFFGVPCIIWSLTVFLVHVKIPFIHVSIRIPGTKLHLLNYGTLLSVLYILFYIHLDKIGGCLYVPLQILYYITAVNARDKDQNQMHQTKGKKSVQQLKSFSSWSGTGGLLKRAGILHFLGWYVQIHPGHGIFEGAKPAVLSSVGGALTSAPLFAFYEGLWFIGVNKQLQKETKVLVDKYTKEMCLAGSQMRVCSKSLHGMKEDLLFELMDLTGYGL